MPISGFGLYSGSCLQNRCTVGLQILQTKHTLTWYPLESHSGAVCVSWYILRGTLCRHRLSLTLVLKRITLAVLNHSKSLHRLLPVADVLILSLNTVFSSVISFRLSATCCTSKVLTNMSLTPAGRASTLWRNQWKTEWEIWHFNLLSLLLYYCYPGKAVKTMHSLPQSLL